MTPEGSDTRAVALAHGAAVSQASHPSVIARSATDRGVLDQERVFTEAVNQTRPLAPSEAEARPIATVIRKGNASRHGLSRAAAERQCTTGRSLDSFTKGPNPRGLAAEVVAVSDYRELHAGTNPGIVNAPSYVCPNVRDIRLSPDASSRKDLILAIDMKGQIVWKYNGQVKTGRPDYVANTLVEMANTPDYGKVGYVDSRYVNPDGSPRVAADGFTPGQAWRLQEAGVCLRGLPDLEARAEQLMANIYASKDDGLNPAARHELQLLRDDIAAAYGARSVVGRVGGGAALAAASAAVVSLVVQLASSDEVDAKAVGESAGIAALFGAGGIAADAGLYHFAVHVREMAPEAAKEFAKQGTAVGFCAIAVVSDVVWEVRAAHREDVTVTGAVGGTAAKVALDLLPLVMAPLGLIGLPIQIVAQIGGRRLIAKARQADIVLEQAISADRALATGVAARITAFTREVDQIATECAETDAIFNRVMDSALSLPPDLRRSEELITSHDRRA